MPKRGRPVGNGELRRLEATGSGGRTLPQGADPNPWFWRCQPCDAVDDHFEHSDSDDEWLPDEISDDGSSNGDSDVELSSSEDEDDEDQHVEDLSNLMYDDGSSILQGYRLINIVQLNGFLNEAVCCRECAEQRTSELLLE